MENKTLAMAILEAKPKEKEEDVDETKEAMVECAQDMLNAIQERDTVAFKDALYGFLEIYGLHEAGESDEEEKVESDQYDRDMAETKARNSF